MVRSHHIVLGCCVALMAVDANIANGQDFPNKPVRIVAGGIGGNGDFMARLIAQGISGHLGQPVIVDNRGSGTIPGEIVSKSAPDGYTLLITSGSHWLGPLMQAGVPYDPVKDFLPVSWTNKQPNVLVVHPSLPVRSVKELIALAKARPKELNYSTGATGAPNHLAGELFNVLAGINIVRIPYKSSATEMVDLIGGQVQLTFGYPAPLAPHIKSGKVRALAVTSAGPSSLFPALPPIASSGVPGYESLTITGIFAPARTPTPIVNRLSQEIGRFLKTAEAKERLLITGVEAVGSSPEEFEATIKADIVRWARVIREAGIQAN